jgi:hypothetical protein
MARQTTRQDFHRRGMVVALAVLAAGCSSAKVVSSHDTGARPGVVPAIVYVTDFDLDEADVTTGPGLLPSLPRPGLLPSGPLGILRTPQATARDAVDLMAKSLVDDLDATGVEARRLPAGAQLPPQGWLVRGAFLDVDTGNRLRRAVIGFGAGQTDLQVATSVDDLSTGTPAPFYQLDTNAESGKLPGAAVTLNPYVAAARFVLAGGDLDRNVKQTAKEIAKAIVTRVHASAPSTTP